MILWVWSGDIDIRGCATCPWSSLYDYRRSHDLISIDLESIAKRVEGLRADIFFLHGGEPIYKPWLSFLVETLSQRGIKLGLKARIEVLEKLASSPITRLIEALLVEIPSHTPKDLLKRALYKNLEILFNLENLYIELLFTDTSPEKPVEENLAELNRSLERIPTNKQPVPIGIQAQNLTEPEILSLMRIVDKVCSGLCYIIESSSKISPEEIKCPRCGTTVARRKEVLVIPIRSDSVECPRCGGRIFRSRFNRIKRTYPVLSSIYLL